MLIEKVSQQEGTISPHDHHHYSPIFQYPSMLAQPSEKPAGKGDVKSAESPGSASQGVVLKRGFGAKRQLLNNWPFDSQHPIHAGRLSYDAIKNSHI